MVVGPTASCPTVVRRAADDARLEIAFDKVLTVGIAAERLRPSPLPSREIRKFREEFLPHLARFCYLAELRERCGKIAFCARSTRLGLAKRFDGILIPTSGILGPAEKRVVVARRIRVEAKAVLGAFDGLDRPPLENPEIGKQGPALGMIGIETKPLLELGHSCLELPLICTQIAENDVCLGVFRIDLDGFPGGRAGCSAMFVYRFPVVQRVEMVTDREPGMCPGEVWLDLDGPDQQGTSRPCFPE